MSVFAGFKAKWRLLLLFCVCCTYLDLLSSLEQGWNVSPGRVQSHWLWYILFKLSGTAKDYEEWLAHSTDEADSERNGCVLGVKETYRRLKRQSVCRNGRSFVVSKKQRPCLCIREDYIWYVKSSLSNQNLFWLARRMFHCVALFNSDYGYYRHVNTSECVRQSNTNKTLELCLNGEEDELLTAG